MIFHGFVEGVILPQFPEVFGATPGDVGVVEYEGADKQKRNEQIVTRRFR